MNAIVSFSNALDSAIITPAVRTECFVALGERVFDLLVIGGGITGCGIARDAALRGLSVALVEKDDFASGTSSRSSRLVHGGVRYLEHGQVHLVFEASAERRRLLALAPHLVRPLQFTWPVYEGARIPRWKLGAGLTLYDALALFRNVGRHRRLDRDALLAEEPMLEPHGLRGGARYFDAATNDARLTLANAVAAAEAGAVILNHCAATELSFQEGHVTGASVRDRMTGATATIRATVVVNATGPWSDRVHRLDEPAGPEVRGSKGVHIAVPRNRIGNNHALTLLSPRDGRVMFTLPAGANAIIGTTDTYTSSSPDDVRASNDDVLYLLDTANSFFPRAALTPGDVIAAWAGIRPLVASRSDSPGAVSREHAVSTSEHGLVSITGGKLTTYRVMAADVMAVVLDRLQREKGPDPTESLPLPGGDFESLDVLIDSAGEAMGDTELATHLATTYGTRWTAVWRAMQAPHGLDRVVETLPYRIGELRYAVQNEMACTIGDLWIRRTHIAFETRDHGVEAACGAVAAVAPLLGWDAPAQQRAIKDYEREVERIFGVDS